MLGTSCSPKPKIQREWSREVIEAPFLPRARILSLLMNMVRSLANTRSGLNMRTALDMDDSPLKSRMLNLKNADFGVINTVASNASKLSLTRTPPVSLANARTTAPNGPKAFQTRRTVASPSKSRSSALLHPTSKAGFSTRFNAFSPVHNSFGTRSKDTFGDTLMMSADEDHVDNESGDDMYSDDDLGEWVDGETLIALDNVMDDDRSDRSSRGPFRILLTRPRY